MDCGRGWHGPNVQCPDSVKSVKGGNVGAVRDQVIDATIPNNLSCFASSIFQAGKLGEVALKDMNVGTLAQLCGHLFLGRSLIASQTDD